MKLISLVKLQAITPNSKSGYIEVVIAAVELVYNMYK